MSARGVPPQLVLDKPDFVTFMLAGNRGSRSAFRREDRAEEPCLRCDTPTDWRVLALPDVKWPEYAICPTCQRAPRGFTHAEEAAHKAARAGGSASRKRVAKRQ